MIAALLHRLLILVTGQSDDLETPAVESAWLDLPNEAVDYERRQA